MSEKYTLELLENTFQSLIEISNVDLESLQCETLLNLHFVINHYKEDISIQKSRYHGNGVFAERNFSKGEIVTFYPCHYLLMKRNDKIEVFTVLEDLQSCNDDIRNRYTYSINPKISICGDPSRIFEIAFVGHIVNDGISTKSKIYDRKEEIVYTELSKIRNNCEYTDICGMCIAIVTTRNVSKGEEFLVSYGYKYWVDMNGYY